MSRRLMLFHSSLAAGGAERVLSTMASYWAAHGAEVHLVTLCDPRGDFYQLDPHVARLGFGLLKPSRGVFQAVAENLKRLLRLRRAIRRIRPDVVIAFSDRNNVLALIAALGTGVPVIVSERNHPGLLSLGRAWKALRRLTYRHASAVVVQTEAVAAWVRSRIRTKRLVVIPNPVSSPEPAPPWLPAEQQTVVAVGRLESQKGFDLLVRAFAACAGAFPAWRLTIVGEGSLRRTLTEMIAAAGLEDRIALPGITQDVQTVLRRADLFVLSSLFEGFPNALLEAMACGLPVVAFDCPSGPSEIVRDGIDGVLVPPADPQALASAMAQLMSDPGGRQRLGAAAAEVTSRFGIETVMARWTRLVEQVAERPPSPSRHRGDR